MLQIIPMGQTLMQKWKVTAKAHIVQKITVN